MIYSLIFKLMLFFMPENSLQFFTLKYFSCLLSFIFLQRPYYVSICPALPAFYICHLHSISSTTLFHFHPISYLSFLLMYFNLFLIMCLFLSLTVFSTIPILSCASFNLATFISFPPYFLLLFLNSYFFCSPISFVATSILLNF